MTKNYFLKTVWQFVFLIILIFGARGVCFSQTPQMQVNGDEIVTGSLSVLGNTTLSGTLNAVNSTVNVNNLNATGTTTLGATTASSLSLGGQSLTAWTGVGPNLLVNSEFLGDVHPSQVGTANCNQANCVRTDNTYNIDMWKFFSTGSAGSAYNYLGTTASSNAGTYRWIAAHANASSSKIGLAQIVENALTVPVKGQKVSLSFAAEYLTSNLSSAGVTAGILCWTGTADAPTSIYSSNSVPTLGSSSWSLLASVNTGTLASTWGTYKLENISVPNSCNNIAVSFWNPSAENNGTIWQIANPKLEMGTVSTPYVPDAVAVSKSKIYRYVWMTAQGLGYSYNANIVVFAAQFPVPMRCNSPSTNPALSTPLSPVGFSLIYQTNSVFDSINPSVSNLYINTNRNNYEYTVYLNNFSGLTPGAVYAISYNNLGSYYSAIMFDWEQSYS